MINRNTLVTALVSAVLANAATAGSHVGTQPVPQGEKNVPEFQPAFDNQTRAPMILAEERLATEIVVDDLARPWGIEVLPEGGYLVTEREGRLRVIAADGTLRPAVKGVPRVLNVRQGGLLDVALADDFTESRRIYFTYAKPMPDHMSATAAATGVLNEDMSVLSDVRDIFVQRPPSPTPMHYGSRIVLDGNYAYVTTGEHSSHEERVFAQDLDKTYGKVVRITLDGAAAPGNPFADRDDAVDTIWTLGHRNIQGADIRPATGELWTLEHGPQGGDELNRIEPGANYGWPVVSYGEQYSGDPIGSGKPRAEGFVEPRYYWDPVIAPGGFVWYEGDMFDWDGDVIASSLDPGGIVRLTLDGDTVTGEARYLTEELGRVRDVEVDHDGSLLVLTDYGNGAVIRVTRASE